MTRLGEKAAPQGTYRVVELSDVSDRAIEEALNREAAAGHRFESVHFVTQPGSRRPTMAFLFFRGIGPGGEA
ncbi:MAG: DUF4177 domain-containing protein [Verrucomicrobiota bacterium]